MGCAQTGTGKTAGFALPILQMLAPHQNTSPSPARHSIRALILTPTRELAAQVEESVRDYGKYLRCVRTVVYGGVDINPQIKALREGVEILVATPGRLLDHVQQKTVNPTRVEILVLDEADRMLDMGFMPDIKRIIALLPAQAAKPAVLRHVLRTRSDGWPTRSCAHPVSVEVAAATPPPISSRIRCIRIDARQQARIAHPPDQDPRHEAGAGLLWHASIDANRLMRELRARRCRTRRHPRRRTQGERDAGLETSSRARSNVLVATDSRRAGSTSRCCRT